MSTEGQNRIPGPTWLLTDEQALFLRPQDVPMLYNTCSAKRILRNQFNVVTTNQNQQRAKFQAT